MTEILAVFRSRTQAIECKAKLCSLGIPAAVVATPSELKLGCGFSVKYPAAFRNAAKHAKSPPGFSPPFGYATHAGGANGYFIKKV